MDFPQEEVADPLLSSKLQGQRGNIASPLLIRQRAKWVSPPWHVLISIAAKRAALHKCPKGFREKKQRREANQHFAHQYGVLRMAFRCMASRKSRTCLSANPACTGHYHQLGVAVSGIILSCRHQQTPASCAQACSRSHWATPRDTEITGD
jgi:hypothetical protein